MRQDSVGDRASDSGEETKVNAEAAPSDGVQGEAVSGAVVESADSYRSPLLDLPGAVIGEGIDEAVAEHYGGPFPEQRALEDGRAFTDLSHTDVVVVTGADRLKLINLLSTQLVDTLPPGSSTELMTLSPTGHIESAVGLFDDGEAAWVLADVGLGQPFVDFLLSMRFMMRVEAEVRADLAVLGGYSRAGEDLRAVALHGAGDLPVLWEDPWPDTAQASATYGPVDAEHPAYRSRRYLAVVAGEELSRAAAELAERGLQPAGMAAWEATRVGQWRPRPATEVVERALPHELDWLRTAVHLHKGCYRGQETVAKLVNLGRPPRRLTLLYLEGPADELPARGDVVKLGERAVGVVTSAVRHFEDGPLALALLRRNAATDAVVSIGNFQASQQEIVTPEGKSSASPADRPGHELRGHHPGPSGR
ncbi:folate-binding protein [Actinomycetaceae bacterium L2_0104]